MIQERRPTTPCRAKTLRILAAIRMRRPLRTMAARILLRLLQRPTASRIRMRGRRSLRSRARPIRRLLTIPIPAARASRARLSRLTIPRKFSSNNS